MTLTVLSVAYPFAPVSTDAVGGAEQILHSIDRGLVEAGFHSVVIACEGSEAHGALHIVPALGAIGDDIAMNAVRQTVRTTINALVQRYRLDLVHLHGIDFHHYLPKAGVPVLASLHLPLAWYPAEALVPDRPQTFLHCVSRSQERDAPPNARFLPPIPNGVDVEAFAVPHAKRSFALMLARICPEKGVHLAIEAARLADVPLLIGGEVFAYPDHERYFREEVAPLLDAERRFIGPVGFEQKRRLLATARCVLVPSVAPETSSLVAREAAAAGTAVIAFRNGALEETIEEGRTGFLVDNVAEMAVAIRRSDEIDRRECRAVARKRFSRATMIQQYLATYAGLAARAHATMDA